jgi:hypothetical protein
MAEIDHRVRLLMNALMSAGFGWLAAEIVDAIEAGRENPEDQDHNVASQRLLLKLKLAGSASTTAPESENLRFFATRSVAIRPAFGGDDQVRLAVNLLVDRLSVAAEMTSHAVDALSTLTRSPVSLVVKGAGESRAVNPSAAVQTGRQLREMREELTQWLLSQTTADGL